MTGIFLLAVLLACSPAEVRRPAVILISLDTVRADALDALGEDGGALTPNLRRLADDSIRFERAYAPRAFTLSSHMSMLTGLRPEAHGVEAENDRLALSIPMLAATLREAGYRTAARVTSKWLRREFGFGRGFESHEELPGVPDATFADRVTDEGIRLVDEFMRGEEPFFVLLHFYDAHSDWGTVVPYTAPEAHRSSRVDYSNENAYCDADEVCATVHMLSLNRSRESLSPVEIEDLRSLYHAGIASVDHELGRLFEHLRQIGIYESTLLIVTSDHGEEFREHGLFGHSQIYEETLRVPLLVKLPGNANGATRVDSVVELVDIAPTVLDVVGIESDWQIQGESLARLAETPRQGSEAIGRDKLESDVWSLRTALDVLVHDRASGRSELYSASDPGQQRNLAADRPERVVEMRQRLDAALRESETRLPASGPAAPGAQLFDADEIRELEALGYLESHRGSQAGGESGAALGP